MKTLLAVRHAKSSWANLGEADFERSLNERGKRDAPEMASRMLSRKLKIGAFVSSPAKRARMTCEAFATAYGLPKNQIIFIDKLYHAPAPVFYDVINKLTTSADTIALFAHNTGITDFVNSLCPGTRIDNMPTCGVFAVQADIKDWHEFAGAEKKLLFIDYPKLGAS